MEDILKELILGESDDPIIQLSSFLFWLGILMIAIAFAIP
jgi:hypothetical protein